MAKLYNLAVMTVSGTPGTGTITLGVAVAPYLTFALAGVSSGEVVFYSITDGTSNSEVGIGTYTSAGTTLTRGPYRSTNSNAAISASSSSIVRIAALASDGGDLLTSTTNPLRGADTPVNLMLSPAVAANALTISVKANNGSNASTTNPIMIAFHDPAGASSNTSPGSVGDPVWRAVTAALSITVPSGQTLGTANSVPFRFWIMALDNGGTVELAVINCAIGAATPTAVATLAEHNLISTTAIAAAPNAGVAYSTTARASLPMRILGYVEFAGGQATAGTYATAPSNLQLFGPGVYKPGDVVQSKYATDSTNATAAGVTKVQTSTTVSITMTSACNVIKASAAGEVDTNSAGVAAFAQISRGTGPTLIGAKTGGGTASQCTASMRAWDAPGTVSSTQYVVFIWGSGVATINWNIAGVYTSYIEVEEIMV